jgi:threonine synthase
MDVGTPSNWERIHALYHGDLEALRAGMRWGSRTDAQTLETLETMRACGYQGDPHGAVAFGVLEACLGPDELGIFLATAHEAKFREFREGDRSFPASLVEVMGKPLLSKPLAVDLEALKAELG